MPNTGTYCVIDTGELPPGLQFMVSALNTWGFQLALYGPWLTLEMAVFSESMLYQDSVEGTAAAPWAILDGQLPLTPCSAPSSAPVPTCWLMFGPGSDVPCYNSYPITQGMYLAPGASFPVPIGQGYFTRGGNQRYPCNPTWDNSQPIYWTQASGGRYCNREKSFGCYGAPADAQPVWDTEGPVENPGWICSDPRSQQPCQGPACIGSIIWTRH